MTADIGIVFNRPNDHLWLLRLREWVTNREPWLRKLGIEVAVTPLSSANEALRWRAELPHQRLVVTLGFSRREIEADPKFSSLHGEPIIIWDPNAPTPGRTASASFLDREMLVTCSDVVSQIRKSLIRSALRKQVDLRPPSSERELSGYFSLRYRVWKSSGYLRDEDLRSRTEWEIDFWDRTAVPFCAMTPDGQVIGCVRMIKNYGHEEPCYVAKIQRLLDGVGDQTLCKSFKFPNRLQHPFDLLEEFPGFGAHFRSLIRAGVNVAEVGRVVVDPDHRGKCLSEALVDTVISCAAARRVSCMLLACREELAPLYARSGFQPVPGLRSEKFFNKIGRAS